MSLQLISDQLVATLYFITVFALLSFGPRRKDLRFRWIVICFAILIIACGVIHVIEAWAPSRPLSLLSGIMKLITMATLVPAVIVFIRFLLKLPGQGQN